MLGHMKYKLEQRRWFLKQLSCCVGRGGRDGDETHLFGFTN